MNRKLKITMLTIIMTLLLIPSCVSAATKRIKTEKSYDKDGKVTYVRSCKYDKYGNIISAERTNYDDGKKSTSTEKYTNTYWSKTSILKKVVAQVPEGKSTTTYTNKGLLKKVVEVPNEGPTTTITYKNNGKYITSASAVTSTGNKVFDETYGKYGITSAVRYNVGDGTTFCTEKYTYKNGVARKCVLNFDGRVTTVTYDSHGNMTSIKHVYDDGRTLDNFFTNKYDKDGNLTENAGYEGTKVAKDKMMYRTVFTYTAKKY